MKRISFIFFLFIVTKSFSQNLTYVYRDTLTEAGQMRFQTKTCVAYKTFSKVLLEITNLTDSFKIIYPKDVSISDVSGRQVPLQGRTPYVIPPKATRKCRFMAEGIDFKASSLNVEIAEVHTTGKAENVFSFPPFILDKNTFELVERNEMPVVKVGEVVLKLKNFKYYSKGNVRVWLSVFYSGDKFLGVHCDKIKLQTADGKVTMEAFKPRNNAFYFNKDKKELKLTLKFENPGSKAEKPEGEKLLLEDVFIEYPVYTNKDKISFKVYKQSETTEQVKVEEEEKDDKDNGDKDDKGTKGDKGDKGEKGDK